jgi:hypothetical protein
MADDRAKKEIEAAAQKWAEAHDQVLEAAVTLEMKEAERTRAQCALSNAKAAEKNAWDALQKMRGEVRS